MAAVMVESGEFPLMRGIDVNHQPSRARIYTAWSRAFGSQVPWALNAVADVIEDVFKFELWKDKYLATPQEFFDQIGLGRLNLDDPAALIRALREMPNGATPEQINGRVARNIRIHELREEKKMTQQEIADEVGCSRPTVADVLSGKQAYTQKPDKEPRKVRQYRISQYTKPETAALRIRETFGADFALTLGTILTSG